jgi:glycosyltransferase involved in cell wall biosynthesis
MKSADCPDVSFAIITPARNEARYLQQTIDSLVAQSLRPREWIIVDDGSTDATAAIAEHAAAAHPWIRVVRAPDRGVRIVGAGVIEAFNLGLDSLQCGRTAFLCKLDADLVLPPDYFERLVAHFDADPSLGIASGRIAERVHDQLVLLRYEPEMVFGACKFYRRECFDAIGGIEVAIGWDGIDVYQAMRRGWRTATLDDPALDILHLRRMGTSHKTILHGASRRGRGLHYNRSHPIWVLASAAYRMADRPYVVAGVCVIVGYCTALLRAAPRIADPEFAPFLRRWQMRKLQHKLRRIVRRRPGQWLDAGSEVHP